MLRTGIVGVVLIAGLLAGQAAAQTSAEVAMFSKGHFKGYRTAIAGPSQFFQPLVVRSIVIPAGSEWELCSGNTYTGCRQIRASTKAMVMTVRSARPVAAILPASAGLQTSAMGRGQSLRGLASEYFVAPDNGGNRVAVQPGTAEAMSSRAAEFCRARGWRSSVHGRLQTVGGSVYLADVLCVDSGR